jgi:maleamate amidohydrolase
LWLRSGTGRDARDGELRRGIDERAIWDKFLTDRDKAVFAAGGFGARAGFGKRPALLVIDVNWAFCGELPEPILESIKRWRTSCGEESWVALEYIKQLIEAARAKGLPVIYTTGKRRPDNWDAGSWRWKSTRSDEASGTAHYDIDGNEIVTMIAPGSRDIDGVATECGMARSDPSRLPALLAAHVRAAEIAA